MFYESLPDYYKSKVNLPLVRIHVGLEDIDKMKDDLNQAFAAIC